MITYPTFTAFFRDVMMTHNVLPNDANEVEKLLHLGDKIQLDQTGKLNFICKMDSSRVESITQEIITKDDGTQQELRSSHIAESWDVDWLAYNKDELVIINGVEQKITRNLATELYCQFNAIFDSQITSFIKNDLYKNIIDINKRFNIYDLSTSENEQNIKKYRTTIKLRVVYKKSFELVNYDSISTQGLILSNE